MGKLFGKCKKNEIQGWNLELKVQLQKRLYQVDREDLFLDSVLQIFTAEEGKAQSNKHNHFRTELGILIFNAAVVAFNSCATIGCFDEQSGNYFMMASTVSSIFATCLIGYRGVRQWREAWLRHRNSINAFLEECQNYANYTGKYPEYCEKDQKSKGGTVVLDKVEKAAADGFDGEQEQAGEGKEREEVENALLNVRNAGSVTLNVHETVIGKGETCEVDKLDHEWEMLKKFKENVVQILSNNNITFAENMNKNK